MNPSEESINQEYLPMESTPNECLTEEGHPSTPLKIKIFQMSLCLLLITITGYLSISPFLIDKVDCFTEKEILEIIPETDYETFRSDWYEEERFNTFYYTKEVESSIDSVINEEGLVQREELLENQAIHYVLKSRVLHFYPEGIGWQGDLQFEFPFVNPSYLFIRLEDASGLPIFKTLLFPGDTLNSFWTSADLEAGHQEATLIVQPIYEPSESLFPSLHIPIELEVKDIF